MFSVGFENGQYAFYADGSQHVVVFIKNGEEEDMDILDVSVTPEWAHLTLVADIMETNFILIEPDKTISEACSLMQLHNKQGLPVLDNDALVGVITLFDIIYAVLRERGVIE